MVDGPGGWCSPPWDKLAWVFLGSWKEGVMLRGHEWGALVLEAARGFGHWRAERKVTGTRLR